MHRFAVVVALAGACCALAAAPAGAVSYGSRVREATLKNGFKILVLEDHKAPVGVLQVWYRVGSRNETAGHTGLSHLVEHMMFKGTKKIGPDEYSRIISRNGGNENAFTSADYTVYFATLASDRLELAIELEADRMANLVLPDKLFQAERAVVAEERRLRTEDRPAAELFELVSAAAYAAHPYRWPVIGWMNDIQKSTVGDVKAYYRAYYKPNNAFAVVVGDVQADKFVAVLQRHFGALAKEPPAPAVRSSEPPQRGERRVVLRRQAEVPFVVIAYHVPNLLHADSAALDLLAAVLSRGKSARLYDELVYRQRKALSVGASYDDTSRDPGLFTVYGQPLPGTEAGELEAKLLEQVARLQQEPIGAREIEKTKNALEADFLLAQDSLFYQGLLLGQYEIAGNWRLLDGYIPKLLAVKAEDLQRVARTYFTADNRTVGVLSPLAPAATGAAAAPPPAAASEAH